MSTTAGVRTFSFTLPGFDAAAPEVRLLARLLGVMIFVAVALSVYVWSRMQERETALALDQARGQLVEAQTHHGRLLVERTMLRSPGRLGSLAASLDLSAPVSVHDVSAPR